MIFVQRHAQKVLEGRTVGAAREGLVDAALTIFRIADLGYEGQHVIVAAQVRVDASGLGQEILEVGEGLRQQGALGAEEPGGQAGELHRTVAAQAEADLAAGAVLQVNFAEFRLEAGFQGRGSAPLAFQHGQGELDVFAGPQGVGDEVGTGAGIVAGMEAANVDAVSPLALGIGDVEFREDGMFADVDQAEVLFAAELPSQLALPVFQRHVLGLF